MMTCEYYVVADVIVDFYLPVIRIGIYRWKQRRPFQAVQILVHTRELVRITNVDSI